MGKVILFSLAVGIFFGAVVRGQGVAPDEKKAEREPLVATAAEQLNEFALQVYARLLAEHPNENFCFSPYGLHSVLGMAALGAKGPTQDELCLALNWEAEGKPRPQPHAAAALREHLAAALKPEAAAKPTVQLQMHNRLWLQSQIPLQQTFLEECDQYYQSDAMGLDFRGRPMESVKTVNQWFEQKTDGCFKSMLREDEAAQVRFLLANTMNFQGKWDVPFEKNNTKDRLFFPEQGKEFKHPTMSAEAHFPYGEDRAVQVIRLPYVGKTLSMLLILPRQRDGLAKLERGFNARVCAKWNKELNSHQVKLLLPRLQVQHQQEFQNILKSLGIKTAWHQLKADFSGIVVHPKEANNRNSENTFLQFVRQKVALELDETGTEAKVVTIGGGGGFFGGGGLVQPPKPVVMDINHSFIYAIREDQSGALLFLGRMSNPQLGKQK